MSKSLSMDLRERLVSAVECGMSRRSAAKLFSVAPSTAIKWVDQKLRTGSVRPRARGGDYRSHHLEAHADEIVTLAKNSDIPACRPTGRRSGPSSRIFGAALLQTGTSRWLSWRTMSSKLMACVWRQAQSGVCSTAMT